MWQGISKEIHMFATRFASYRVCVLWFSYPVTCLRSIKVKGLLMLPQKRLESLQNKSALIARRVEEEERSPSPDPTILRHLKKQKLELKEIMAGLREEKSSIH